VIEIRASVSPGETRVALLEDDRLCEAWVEREPDGVGDVHRGRLVARAPAMAGAFVLLADGATGFLPETEQASPFAEGDGVIVRITRAAQSGKGPRLTARLSQAAAAGVPALLSRGPDAALRLARRHPNAAVLTDGPVLAAQLRAELGSARVAHRLAPAFDAELEAAFAALIQPEVPLLGGGRLLIHPTPALTAIDVDAGSIAGDRARDAQARFNTIAVLEAARQIRLRNLAGPILLDLAGMARRAREALAPALCAAIAGDSLLRLAGLGPLGLFELERRRVHAPLHEVLGQPPSPLTEGLAALRQAMREAVATPGANLVLRAAPAVLAALRARPAVLAAAPPLQLEPAPGPVSAWSVAHG
jgi:ribonuclease G